MPDPIRIQSHLRTYEVVFSEGPHAVLDELRADKAFVIADPAAFRALGLSPSDAVPRERLCLLEPTEEKKTLDQVQELVAWLVSARARRGYTLVALGGGVIQDLTAFTASILYRGIDWVFVPTTLLAQADSCIGSKTSINAGGSKNIVGNFYPPRKVLIEPRFLESLPEVEIRSGIGEIVHYYVYAASPLLEEIIAEYDRLLTDRAALQPFIAESLRIKKSVIEQDEYDRGERNKFNYGHTFGHAIEALTDFEVRHGQAVMVGMDLANYLSVRRGLLDASEDRSLHRLLKVGFPQRAWGDFDLGRYLGLLGKDKKNVDNDLTCILCEGVGRLVKVKVPLDAGTAAIIQEYFRAGMDR